MSEFEPVSAKLLVTQDPEILRQILSERVAKGVELLDKIDPEWFLKIDLEELDFQGPGRDVLQQLFKDPAKAAEDMGISGQESYFGFFPPMISHCLQLKEAWRQVVQKKAMDAYFSQN